MLFIITISSQSLNISGETHRTLYAKTKERGVCNYKLLMFTINIIYCILIMRTCNSWFSSPWIRNKLCTCSKLCTVEIDVFYIDVLCTYFMFTFCN